MKILNIYQLIFPAFQDSPQQNPTLPRDTSGGHPVTHPGV